MRGCRTPSPLLCALLFLPVRGLSAQEGQKVIQLPTDKDPAGSTMVALCCTPSDLFRENETVQNCTHQWTRKGASDLSMRVENLCDELKAEATVVALDSVWYVSRKSEPGKALFRIDCKTERAWRIGIAPSPAPTAAAQSPAPPPAQAPQVASSPPPADTGKDRQAKATEKVNSRIKDLEKTLAEQKRAMEELKKALEARGVADRKIEKRLDTLETDLIEKLRTLEEAQKSSCYRTDDRYQGQEEVTIAVAGSVLRFLRVKPRASPVPIGLSEARAGELLAQAQVQSSKKIFPHIYLAVPEAQREVGPFFLQDRLIDAGLYSRLTDGKDAARVSYQDVSRFIAELNSRCSGRANFALPTEEQFVAAAHRFYDPAANGLKPCEELRKEDLRSGLTELFGHAWQLTRSLCQPFSDPPRTSCPDGSAYIRKGGAASSTNPLECLPEYRSPSPFDVHQQETSFRLALAD